MSEIRLGLDLGTNSIGWSIVDILKQELFGGVIKFDAGGVINENGYKSSTEIRRIDRSMRRTNDRDRRRRFKLLSFLLKHRMCPITKEELRIYRKTNKQPDGIQKWFDMNPYVIRNTLIHNKLDMSICENRYKFGRILYAICHYRGYKSSNINGEYNEDGDVGTNIQERENMMKERDCKFYGELFYELNKDNVRIHGRKKQVKEKKKLTEIDVPTYTDRNLLVDEVRHICNIQGFSNLFDDLNVLMFVDRPGKYRKWRCPLEKQEYRCSVLHPEYERFRMMQLLNNIYIYMKSSKEKRSLCNDEKDMLMSNLFFKKDSFVFEDIIKLLSKYNNITLGDKYDNDCQYYVNYNKKMSVSGCPVISALIKTFGVGFLNTKEYERAVSIILAKKNPKERVEVFKSVFDNMRVSKDFNAIKKITGYSENAKYSLKAIKRINVFLERGLFVNDAIYLANVPHLLIKYGIDNVDEIVSRFIYNVNCGDAVNVKMVKHWLDDYEVFGYLYDPHRCDEFGGVSEDNTKLGVFNYPNHPTLNRTMSVLRKLINELISRRMIDSDTVVHVETSHEMNSLNYKNAYSQYISKQESDKKKARAKLIELYKEATGVEREDFSDREVLKFQLWEEQNNISVYTGKKISFCDLFGKNPVCDIEHTVPLCMGGTWEKHNLTVCESEFNRYTKKGQLPSELEEYDEILDNLGWLRDNIKRLDCELISAKKAKNKVSVIKLDMELSYYKRKLHTFEMTGIDDGFALRQSHDNSIISKYARKYLKTYFKTVWSVSGVATAYYRHLWGLPEKDRMKNIHHLEDAILIACIDHKEIKRCAERMKRNSYGKPTYVDTFAPWVGFSDDVDKLCSEVIVKEYHKDTTFKQTKRVTVDGNGNKIVIAGRGVRSALHKQTFLKCDDDIVKKDNVVKIKKQSTPSKIVNKRYFIANSDNNYKVNIYSTEDKERHRYRRVTMKSAAEAYMSKKHICEGNLIGYVKKNMCMMLCSSKEEFLSLSSNERPKKIAMITDIGVRSDNGNISFSYRNVNHPTYIKDKNKKNKNRDMNYTGWCKFDKLLEHRDFEISILGEINWKI